MKGSDEFYYEEGGKRKDAHLHADMLKQGERQSAGDHRAAAVAAGVSEEAATALFGAPPERSPAPRPGGRA